MDCDQRVALDRWTRCNSEPIKCSTDVDSTSWWQRVSAALRREAGTSESDAWQVPPAAADPVFRGHLLERGIAWRTSELLAPRGLSDPTEVRDATTTLALTF